MADIPSTEISFSKLRDVLKSDSQDSAISLSNLYSFSNPLSSRLTGIPFTGAINVASFSNQSLPYVHSLAGGTPFPLAIFSTRLLKSDYTGFVVRIRRSSDNVEKDFYADKFGNIRDGAGGTSGTSAYDWLNGATGSLVTWYDQSGNARNATQATTTYQPLCVFYGTNLKMKANYSNGYLYCNSLSTSLSNNAKIIIEYDCPTAVNGSNTLLHRGFTSGTAVYNPRIRTNSIRLTAPNPVATYTPLTTRRNVIMSDVGGTAGTRTVRLNAAALTSGINLTTAGSFGTSTVVSIGAENFNTTTALSTFGSDAFIYTVIAYANSTNVSGVDSFINDFCASV